MEKILIVDDNKQNCDILDDIMSTWGFEVIKAFQGMEAIEAATKYNPDVILLDVMLPGMNGFEVCNKLKNSPETQGIPILMLTVLNEVEDRIRGFKVGADLFLSKPINYQELKIRITTLINQKKTVDKMEQQEQVVHTLRGLIKAYDYNLFLQVSMVKEYCEKVKNVLSLTEEQNERLIIGAYLHDLGKIISGPSKEHVEMGIELLRPLKMGKWLNEFILNHHEKLNGKGYPRGIMAKELPLEIQVLGTINRFVELFQLYDDKEKSLENLKAEGDMGDWSIIVINALEQVLEDEKFIENFKM